MSAFEVVTSSIDGRWLSTAPRFACDSDLGPRDSFDHQLEMTSLSTYDTLYCADTAEFCPHPDATDILACGTYQLQEGSPKDGASQTRVGRCWIFRVDGRGHLFVLATFNFFDYP
jgi:hypothetical protein